MIDVLLYIVAGICFIVGVIGCWPFLEITGGPIVSFIGLLLLQMTEHYQFTFYQFLLWIGLIVLVSVLPGWIMKLRHREEKPWWKEFFYDMADEGLEIMIGVVFKIVLCCYIIYCAIAAW